MAKNILAICLMLLVASSVVYEVQGTFLLKMYMKKKFFPRRCADFTPFASKGILMLMGNLEGGCPATREFKQFFSTFKSYMSFISTASASKTTDIQMTTQCDALAKAMSLLTGSKSQSSSSDFKLTMLSMGKTFMEQKKRGSARVTFAQRKELVMAMVKWTKMLATLVKTASEKRGKSIDISSYGLDVDVNASVGSETTESETATKQTGNNQNTGGAPATDTTVKGTTSGSGNTGYSGSGSATSSRSGNAGYSGSGNTYKDTTGGSGSGSPSGSPTGSPSGETTVKGSGSAGDYKSKQSEKASGSGSAGDYKSKQSEITTNSGSENTYKDTTGATTKGSPSGSPTGSPSGSAYAGGETAIKGGSSASGETTVKGGSSASEGSSSKTKSESKGTAAGETKTKSESKGTAAGETKTKSESKGTAAGETKAKSESKGTAAGETKTTSSSTTTVKQVETETSKEVMSFISGLEKKYAGKAELKVFFEKLKTSMSATSKLSATDEKVFVSGMKSAVGKLSEAMVFVRTKFSKTAEMKTTMETCQQQVMKSLQELQAINSEIVSQEGETVTSTQQTELKQTISKWEQVTTQFVETAASSSSFSSSSSSHQSSAANSNMNMNTQAS